MNSSSLSSPSRPWRVRLGRVLVAVLAVSSLFVATAPSSPASASSKLCGEQILAEVTRMSGLLKLPPPPVNLNQPAPSSYSVGSGGQPGALNFEPCVSKSVIAHELGHYVVDRAARFDWNFHLYLAAGFTQYRNWLRTSADVSGVERAAHCVGYQLVKNGTYTKCPHSGARSMARRVVSLAQW